MVGKTRHLGNEDKSSAILAGTRQALSSRSEGETLEFLCGINDNSGVIFIFEVSKPLVGRQLDQVVETWPSFDCRKTSTKRVGGLLGNSIDGR